MVGRGVRGSITSKRTGIFALIGLLVLVNSPSPLTEGAVALDDNVDLGNVRPLWDAWYQDRDGVWHQGIDGRGVTGMTFEGFNSLHPDLEPCAYPDGNIIFDETFPVTDEDAHGDHTTGIVCGRGTMSDGRFMGVAHGARMVSSWLTCVRINDIERGCDIRDLYDRHPWRVVTNSISNDPIGATIDRKLDPAPDILYVSAMGNEAGDGETSRSWAHTQSDPRLVMVAAADEPGTDVAFYSSKGAKDDPSTWPDVSAPGCSYSLSPPPHMDYLAFSYYSGVWDLAFESKRRDCDNSDLVAGTYWGALGYTKQMGTSMATPFTAGVGLLMMQVNPELNGTVARTLLRETTSLFIDTDDLDRDGKIERFEFLEQHGWKAGTGLVDGVAAVAAAHYLALHEDAPVEEAILCSGTAHDATGTLILNPPGLACRLPEQDDRIGAPPPPAPERSQVLHVATEGTLSAAPPVTGAATQETAKGALVPLVGDIATAFQYLLTEPVHLTGAEITFWFRAHEDLYYTQGPDLAPFVATLIVDDERVEQYELYLDDGTKPGMLPKGDHRLHFGAHPLNLSLEVDQTLGIGLLAYTSSASTDATGIETVPETAAILYGSPDRDSQILLEGSDFPYPQDDA